MQLEKLLFVVLLILSQTVSSKIYNVQNFGATPNDSKDDTNAIQKCIDTAAKNGGGTVYFPIGKYIVSRAIIKGKAWCLFSKSNIVFKGENRQKSIIQLKKSQQNYTRILYIENVENVAIDNLTFDGNAQNQANPSNPNEHLHAVFIDTSNNIRVANSDFINTGGDGLGIRGVKSSSKKITIDHCRFANNQRNGITLGSGFDGVEIKNCIFEKTIDDSPIDTEPTGGTCQNVLIENNKFYTPTVVTVGGSNHNNTGKNFRIINNAFYNCGMMMVNAENIFVENNNFLNTSEKMMVFRLVNYNKNINITNNNIESSGKEILYAVTTQNAKKQIEFVKFENNKVSFSGSGKTAFHLRGSNDVHIKNNEINLLGGQNARALLVASNYPVKNINFSGNRISGFDQPMDIQPLRNNSIENIKIENNIFSTKNKNADPYLLNIPKKNKNLIKNPVFRNNKQNGIIIN